MMAGIAQLERGLLSERVKSALTAARRRGRKLGRQPGQRRKSVRLAPKVLRAVDDGTHSRGSPFDGSAVELSLPDANSQPQPA